jgi:hypothetical protein
MDYPTRQDFLAMQEQSARLAQRIADEFRSLGLAGVKSLTEEPTIVVDISIPYPTFSVTLTGDRTLSFVGGSAALDRRKIILEVTQGTSGGWSLVPDSSVVFGTDITDISLSAQPGKTDVLGFLYIDSIGKYRLIAISHGY